MLVYFRCELDPCCVSIKPLPAGGDHTCSFITCHRAYTSSSPTASTVLSQPANGKINLLMWGAQTTLCSQGPQHHPCRKQEAQPYCDTGLGWLSASGTHCLQHLLRCKAWQWDAPGWAPASPGLQSTVQILRLHLLLSYCKSHTHTQKITAEVSWYF